MAGKYDEGMVSLIMSTLVAPAMGPVLFEDLLIAQLTVGNAWPRIQRFPLGGATLHVHEFRQGVELRTKVPQAVTLVGCVIESQAPIVLCGTQLPQGDLIVASGAEVDLCSHGPCTFVWLELPTPGWAESADVIAAGSISRFKQGCMQAAALLRDTFKDRRAERKGCARSRRRTRRRSLDAGPVRFGPAAVRAARRIEEFMWVRVDEPISLKALADFSGRGVRTVIYSFQTSYDLGPLSYFKIRRLGAVRDQIVRRRKNTTIIDVAAEFGFWHLGHFGHDYRALFGETPSQTRMRSPAQHRDLQAIVSQGAMPASLATHWVFPQSLGAQALNESI